MDLEVALREPALADVDVFFAQEQDPEAARRANFTPRSRAEFVHHWTQRILGDDTVDSRTVTVDGETAGNVVAWWQDGRRTIGYWLGREFWGRGIGTEALRQFLERERFRPLYADTDVSNTVSLRLLRRCGFEHVETVKTGNVEYVVLKLS
ncbi:GNAT family N-acetyltransferase [Couchioplanes azureus]|uniref:GNAT family N-acetyltransferase n=1 Tax=Couchioplanes caeruleus TaxID=56438 RepID=UPI00166FE063|nr:GNAT family N-acetyltransferase [Couchioplanes caeruleus]GGQ56097.1 N-acetyltransferase GCN5 [Couchioplanes caeruleus subsp. azureus]